MNRVATQFASITPIFHQNPTATWLFNESSINKPHSPLHNKLLSALTTLEYNRLLPYLELVAMPIGDLLCGMGEHLHYVYFPTTAIVALTCHLENGATAAIAIVGNEGIVGVSSFMGGGSMPNNAIVQNAGFGYRLKVQHLKYEFNHAGTLFSLLLRYIQALITQMSLIVVCNRHHTIEQHLCRFLLLSLDRSPTNTLSMTQELISRMIGARRVGVTKAAGNLQRAGMIQYVRGKIEVSNRPKLEKNVCECYSVVKSEFDRLLTSLPKSRI